MTIRLPNGTVLQLAAHALDRYNERICPALDRDAALDHLRRLAALSGHVTDRPAWSITTEERFHPSSWWLELTPDIGLVVRGVHVVTVLCRGAITATQSDRRRRRRQGRRAHARWSPPRQERAAARRRRRDRRAPGLEEDAA